MDLGCLDLGCISLLEKCNTNDNAPVDRSPKEENDSSRSGKNKSPKETSPTSLSALNKIRKPPRRKGSPLGWFPRKKVEPYLKRKIKLLQEVNGMNSTLDETLGDSCPHYSRVKREQIAAREAALKAIEARKAAMVEASWCRILRAARIQIKEAEDILINAERAATEAFEAATSMGVIMYDAPNYPRKSCKIRSSSNNGGGFTTHAIAASFETAFEVDKEVAAAVKTAFTQLANCPSVDKDEFKELLRKISQNPDVGGNRPELSDFSSEYESDTGSELEPDVQDNDADSQDSTFRILNDDRAKKGSARKRQICKDLSMNKLVEMMLGRMKCLHDDELESLATIVATCGLSAALDEVESDRRQESLNFARRMSSIGSKFAKNSQMQCFMDGKAGQKQADSELPSLDKFLVRHMSKLEREVLEAKTKRQNEVAEGAEGNIPKIDESSLALTETTPDLGSVLVKHSSKFEKEIEEAKRNNGKTYENVKKKSGRLQTEVEGHCQPELPSLDKFLVKHLSRLEREVQEAKNRKENVMKDGSADVSNSHSQEVEKENVDLNQNMEKNEQDAMKENENSLEKILVKPVHKLEREKMQASAWEKEDYGILQRHQKRQGGSNVPDCESLDKVLVKHFSRLEKEKMEFNSRQNEVVVKGKNNGGNVQQGKNGGGGLDQILIKRQSRLEREKIASFTKEQTEDQPRAFVTRREAREREMQEAWGGLSLGNSVKPHLSRLERDRAAWIKAEEEEKRLAMKQAS